VYWNRRGLICLALALSACADEPLSAEPPVADPGDAVKAEPGKSDASAEAVILDLAFSAKVQTAAGIAPEVAIADQLFYTLGPLNGDDAVGRLDTVALSNIRVTPDDLVTYDAVLQVAWRKSKGLPAGYTFRLPLDITPAGQGAFTERHMRDCVADDAHHVHPGNMWYYYRADRRGCRLHPDEAVEALAEVSVSDVNTSGRYPEYDKVWEDGRFVVVAIFGKNVDGATRGSDAGVAAYSAFNGAARGALRGRRVDVTPSNAGASPGVEAPYVIYRAQLSEGREVEIHALLIDDMPTVGAAFDELYGPLSAEADFIAYNGHARFGASQRVLAEKSRWRPGQYTMLLFNGCDTFAYLDSAVFDAHAAINDDDETGTRYADIMTNALPAFFSSMPAASMAVVEAMLRPESPRTYEQIFQSIDRAQVVVVTGEHDNVFVPGGVQQPETTDWDGMSLSGAPRRGERIDFETPVLPAGAYSFTMSGTGDADLYVRAGLAPTPVDFDCRPYRRGTDEACLITLGAPAAIHGMVVGAGAGTRFELAGAAEPQ